MRHLGAYRKHILCFWPWNAKDHGFIDVQVVPRDFFWTLREPGGQLWRKFSCQTPPPFDGTSGRMMFHVKHLRMGLNAYDDGGFRSELSLPSVVCVSGANGVTVFHVKHLRIGLKPCRRRASVVCPSRADWRAIRCPAGRKAPSTPVGFTDRDGRVP